MNVYRQQIRIRVQNGFTLIELLVVISIIGILAALALVSYPAAQKTARDTQRKSDLKQYQNLLETFANGNDGYYPGRTSSALRASTTLCSDLNDYFDPDVSCPVDPRDGDPYRYYFQSNTGSGATTATQYTLRGQLESKSVIWVICSNGESGTVATSTSFSLGNCPSF